MLLLNFGLLKLQKAIYSLPEKVPILLEYAVMKIRDVDFEVYDSKSQKSGKRRS